MTKSPFYIIQDFISPVACEQMVDALNCWDPDSDKDDAPISKTMHHDRNEETVYTALLDHIDDIREHYNIEYKGMERINFEWYPHACDQSDVKCGNSIYARKQWVRNKDRDLTAVLFFSDYQDKIPFDSEYEVYGGKLEFPQHHFGFNPQRGTLIVFPSDPHFLNVTNTILAGDLFMARMHIAASQPYMYQPNDFPGDYRTWFDDVV